MVVDHLLAAKIPQVCSGLGLDTSRYPEPETNKLPLKINAWKMNFLLGQERPIVLRLCFTFREGTPGKKNALNQSYENIIKPFILKSLTFLVFKNMFSLKKNILPAIIILK